MRVALFSDVHGNTPGLEAVFGAIDELGGADVIVCAGDMIFGGPGHADVLDRLAERDVRMLRGNHEELYLDRPAHIHKMPRENWEYIRRFHDYLDANLSAEHLQLLAGLPLAIEIPINDGQVLQVCHATPADPWLYVCNPHTTVDELELGFGSSEADLIAHGHWHWHHMIKFREKHLINVASVGERQDGLSSLTVLDTRPGGWSIRQLQVPYNTVEEDRLMRVRSTPRPD